MIPDRPQNAHQVNSMVSAYSAEPAKIFDNRRCRASIAPGAFNRFDGLGRLRCQSLQPANGIDRVGPIEILYRDPAEQTEKPNAGPLPGFAPHDGDAVNLIGVQLQAAGMPASMTPQEAMQFFCAYHGVAPRLDLLDRFGLREKRETQFQELSTGQQRRIGPGIQLLISRRTGW